MRTETKQDTEQVFMINLMPEEESEKVKELKLSIKKYEEECLEREKNYLIKVKKLDRNTIMQVAVQVMDQFNQKRLAEIYTGEFVIEFNSLKSAFDSGESVDSMFYLAKKFHNTYERDCLFLEMCVKGSD